MNSPIDIPPEEFRRLGAIVADWLAELMATIGERPVSGTQSPATVRAALGSRPLPEEGADPEALLAEAAELLLEHSLFNGHPRFHGYITSSPAPVGVLADFLASGLNQNVGWWGLSPMANEIEAQTVRWLAELVGYPPDCGGLLVTGGNMANFIGFLVARKARTVGDVRAAGLAAQARQLCVYCSEETHTWIHKAADMFGVGTDFIRWISADAERRMRIDELVHRIDEDTGAGRMPFMVVGTGGSVGTGAVDPLPQIAQICRERNLWFHVDGAYGGFAVTSPEAPDDLRALSLADSVAIDPHKWLYAPIEAGCALVRDRELLWSTFSYRPPYFHFDEEVRSAPNYYEYGPQSTRAFRALKVWLCLRHAGRGGYATMISDNISRARELYRLATEHPRLEAFTQHLSITTFRYVPEGLESGLEPDESRLNVLNSELVGRVQSSGEAYVSNAIIDGKFALRACIVNFRTASADMEALTEIVVRLGADLYAAREQPAPPPEQRVDVPKELAGVEVFATVPADALRALAAAGRRRRFQPGDGLMRQGEPSRSMHVVLSGSLRVEKLHPELPEPLPLAVMGPGETVGEMGVLDAEPRSATVIAIEPTETLELPVEAIESAILEFPQLGRALLRTFSRRLRNEADVLARKGG